MAKLRWAMGALVAVGSSAVLLGVASSGSAASHLMWLDDRDHLGSLSAEVVAAVGGRAVLVIAETAACTLFTALAVLAFTLRHSRALQGVCVVAAAIKTSALLAMLAVAWNPGWYDILDPVSTSPARAFIGASVAQAIAWWVVAVMALRLRLRADRLEA